MKRATIRMSITGMAALCASLTGILPVHGDHSPTEPIGTAAITNEIESAQTASVNGAASCEELEWVPTFGLPPVLNQRVRALTVFDDGLGGGPALYAGGGFTTANGVTLNRIARWDAASESWSPLGSGLGAGVFALVVFDDGLGGGPALYAGGSFTTAGGASANRVARWNAATETWSPLGSGMTDVVYALTVFDDGSGGGPALYAGGGFGTAGGVPAKHVARWNAAAGTWSKVGQGFNERVYALTVFDDGLGGGPALYAGGLFTATSGLPANRIARWNPASGLWLPLASGLSSSVQALAVFDDGSGSGPALYAGGSFTSAGGVAANRVAKWNAASASWSPLGSGTDGTVYSLLGFDDGTGGGPALYAGGEFFGAGSDPTGYITRWSATSATWSPVGSGIDGFGVFALTPFDDGLGSGPALHMGGDFSSIGGLMSQVARWNSAYAAWVPMGRAVNDRVQALSVFDDGLGGGPALYAGGLFTAAGGIPVNRIARWDADSDTWSPLGTGMGGGSAPSVSVLSVLDNDLSGEQELYAGGSFITAGGVTVNRIARWNAASATWSPLGSGVSGGGAPWVYALAVYDDGRGGGPALYAGGEFNDAGGVPANQIARWDPVSKTWSPLGLGLGGGAIPRVYALEVFDDGLGGGPALYVGGTFGTAGGAPANFIARWNIASGTWSPLGSGMNGYVHAFKVFDDGSGGGPALYAAGGFSTAGGVSVKNVARWNAATGTWSALPPLGGVLGGPVRSLKVFDDGTGRGPALYAGGSLPALSSETLHQVARLDLDSWVWSPLGNGTTSGVFALTVFDDGLGSGPALFAGGGFTVLPTGDKNLARWGCVEWSPPCAVADLDCDGAVDGNDLAIVLGGWGVCGSPPCVADINEDEVIDGHDLAIILGAWGGDRGGAK